MKKFVSLLALFQLTGTALGADAVPVNFSPDASAEQRALRFSLGLEASNFSLSTGSMTGLGGVFSLHYLMSDRVAMMGNLGLAVSPMKSMGFLYTQFGVHFAYAFSGNYAQGKTRVSWKDRTLVSVRTPVQPSWGVIGGIEQFVLSGATDVYPAPGFSMGLVHRRPWIGRDCQFELRYGMYSTNSISFGGMLFRLSAFLD